MAPDDTLERVRKLLAMAESTTNEHERDAFNTKAAELIARYGIEQAQLDAGRDVPMVPGDRTMRIHAPYIQDKWDLLVAIAKPCRVRTVGLHQQRGTDYRTIHMFGFGADLERVELMFTSLLVQASYGLATARPPEPRLRGYDWHGKPMYYPAESVAAYRRSWMFGFNDTIRQRLEAAEKKATEEATTTTTGTGMELVLADRNAMVAAAVAAQYPKLSFGKPRTLTGSGYSSGKAAGQRADLGSTRIGNGSGRRALG